MSRNGMTVSNNTDARAAPPAMRSTTPDRQPPFDAAYSTPTRNGTPIVAGRLAARERAHERHAPEDIRNPPYNIKFGSCMCDHIWFTQPLREQTFHSERQLANFVHDNIVPESVCSQHDEENPNDLQRNELDFFRNLMEFPFEPAESKGADPGYARNLLYQANRYKEYIGAFKGHYDIRKSQDIIKDRDPAFFEAKLDSVDVADALSGHLGLVVLGCKELETHRTEALALIASIPPGGLLTGDQNAFDAALDHAEPTVRDLASGIKGLFADTLLERSYWFRQAIPEPEGARDPAPTPALTGHLLDAHQRLATDDRAEVQAAAHLLLSRMDGADAVAHRERCLAAFGRTLLADGDNFFETSTGHRARSQHDMKFAAKLTCDVERLIAQIVKAKGKDPITRAIGYIGGHVMREDASDLWRRDKYLDRAKKILSRRADQSTIYHDVLQAVETTIAKEHLVWVGRNADRADSVADSEAAVGMALHGDPKDAETHLAKSLSALIDNSKTLLAEKHYTTRDHHGEAYFAQALRSDDPRLPFLGQLGQGLQAESAEMFAAAAALLNDDKVAAWIGSDKNAQTRAFIDLYRARDDASQSGEDRLALLDGGIAGMDGRGNQLEIALRTQKSRLLHQLATEHPDLYSFKDAWDAAEQAMAILPQRRSYTDYTMGCVEQRNLSRDCYHERQAPEDVKAAFAAYRKATGTDPSKPDYAAIAMAAATLSAFPAIDRKGKFSHIELHLTYNNPTSYSILSARTDESGRDDAIIGMLAHCPDMMKNSESQHSVVNIMKSVLIMSADRFPNVADVVIEQIKKMPLEQAKAFCKHWSGESYSGRINNFQKPYYNLKNKHSSWLEFNPKKRQALEEAERKIDDAALAAQKRLDQALEDVYRKVQPHGNDSLFGSWRP